jgi:hypothetical protein
MLDKTNPHYKTYLDIKTKKNQKYVEEIHCPMIIKVMSRAEGATMSAFCVEAGIGDGTFYKWLAQHPIFDECYRYGCMISQNNWEKEGDEGMYNNAVDSGNGFNATVWQIKGSARYGVGKTNRIRVRLDPSATPWKQYEQLLKQASHGDFTSSELKQLCEALNIGSRVYEQFEMQNEINELKESLAKVLNTRGDNSGTVKAIKETN